MTYEEIRKKYVTKKRTDSSSNVDKKYIESFYNDVNKFNSDTAESSKMVNFNNASTYFEDFQKRLKDLRERSARIKAYLYENRKSMGEEKHKQIVSDIDKILEGQQSNVELFARQVGIYKQYDSEASYNAALKESETLNGLYSMSSADIKMNMERDTADKDAQKATLQKEWDTLNSKIVRYGRGDKSAFKNAKEYNEAKKRKNELSKQINQTPSGIAYTTSSGQNITWQSLYDQKKYEEDIDALYEKYSAMPDWKEKSTFTSKAKKVGERHEMADLGEDILLEYIHGDGQLRDNITNIRYGEASKTGGGGIGSRKYYDYGTDGFDSLTDKEKELWTYLRQTSNVDAENELWTKTHDTIEARHQAKEIQKIYKLSKEHPLGASIMSLGYTLGSVGEFLLQTAPEYLSTGELNKNHSAELSSTIRQGVADKVDWEVGDWDAFDFVYNTGMSLIDSTVSNTVFGGFGGVVLGLSAATQGTNDALDRGMSKGQAFMSGLASGVFEGIFESWSIGAFGDLTKNLKRVDFQNIAKYIGKNMWNNAKEEFLTELANISYDYMFNGDFSQYETSIRQYMSLGLSESEAKKKVATELGVQLAEAAGSGALMGFGFGGYGATSNAINAAQTGKAIKNKGQVGNLVELGKSLGEGTDSYELANKVANKPTALAIGSLLGVAEADILDANRGDIVKSLERKGYDTEKANRLADLMLDPESTLYSNTIGGTAEGEAYKNIVGNPNSTLNQRTQGYLNILDKLEGKNADTTVSSETSTQADASAPYSQEYVDSMAKEFETMGIPSEQARILAEKKLSAPTEANSTSATESVAESKYEVSADGKTINTKSGEVVNVQKIDSISKDGEANLTTDDGMVVKASDLSFGTDAEALFVENIGAIKIGKNPISTNSANLLYMTAMGELKNNPNMTADKAMSLIKGLTESYIYGAYNLGRSKLTARNEDGSATLFAGELTQEQRKYAYELGTKDAVSKAEADQKVIDELKEKAKPKATKKSFGKVIFEKGADVDESTLTKTQKANLNGIKLLAEISSVEFHAFRSDKNHGFKYTMPNGTVTTANGWYVAGTNQIWIDLNAGSSGEGTMIRTAAHEISHYIKQWSPQKWKAMADLLMAEFAKNDVNTESLLNRQIAKIKRRYTKQNMPSEAVIKDMAYEELVSDALSDMLTDGSIVNFIAEVKAKDKNLGQKILDAIKSLLKKWGLIIDDYKGRELDTDEAQALSQFEDTFKKLQEMYQEAFVDANETVATIGARNLADFAEAKNTEGESLFQYRAMEADESTYRDMLKKWGKMSDTQINNLFATIDKAMDIIKDNLEVLDYAWESDIDDRAFSPVKKNTDKLYQVSLDFSTLCRKRILQQTIQAQLQEVLNQPLTREEGIAIRDALMALQEEGRQIEVACALCNVESARMKSPTQIKKFINNREAVIKDFFASKSGGSMKAKIKQAEIDAREKLHKENPNGIKGKDGSMLDPLTASLGKMAKKYADTIRDAKRTARESYKPTAEEQRLIEIAKGMTVNDFVTPSGLENLAKNYPDLFDAYAGYIVNATHSKGIENDTWWRAGDSSNIGDVLIANMNRENGLRSQSWSDFQVIHILDYIAATIELSTRNAKEQAYSKVPDYIELMGQTGVMLNMSLIPARRFNGSLEYDSVEGMDYKRALELREKYPATAGTICIGVDNKQIQMLLADATIDYVIPYHKSGMAASIRKLMHIPTWSQYEEYQSEKHLSRKEAEAQAKRYGVKLLAESNPNYHKHTAFSEWFDLEAAKQIAKMENANPTNKAMQKEYGVMYGGYMAMQNAANNYLKLCAERGISPKFSHENADFTAEDNYWKLLIDRKMVNNATGEIIEQQTIKPIFDEGEVLRILKDELERYPSVKGDQEYATRKVIEKFLSGEIKSGMSAEAIAKVMKKPVDNIAKTNILASAESEIKLSDRDTDDFKNDHRIPYTNRADQFSYEILTSKPDMKITSLGGKIPTNRADVVYQAKKNAASVGKTDKNGSVSVYVDDVGTEVILATKGLSHGLRRISRAQTDPNFFVTLKAGEIIKNSIKINELIPSKENASGSYVLIGVAKNTNGDMYIVRSVVNHFNNELDSMDILYAINAKKEELAATKSPRFTGKPLSVTSSTISIADLLNYVNEYFPDILPEDVLRHYKYVERPSGDFSESVLFSERDSWNNIKSIQGLDGYSVDDVIDITKNHIQSILQEYGEYAEIVAIRPYGSRAKGTAKNDSDLDIVVQYEGDIREDSMFDMLNDEDSKLYIEGIEVDINPIRADDSGDIEDYLGRVYDFDKYSQDNKYSTRDSEGNTLSEGQQDFFKDSKVRDEDGNLKVVYHGTPNGGFTEFQLPHYLSSLTSAQGAGYYFTDKQNAKQYMKGLNGKSVSQKALYKVYLNITNPLQISEYSTGAISDDAFRKIMARGNYEWGMSHTDVEKRLQVSKLDSDRLAEMVKVFNGEGILTVMREELGYDGVRFTDRYGDIWVAWDKSQIKDTSNKTPTTNPDIRYSLRDVDPIEPTSNKWQRTLTTSEVKAKFPDLWDVSADESEARNPTQISGTVRSYRKVYDFLKKTDFKGNILDASSGLGYGTKAGIEEYGFDVEDIEPYPDKSYSPKYTDYSSLDKKYDVIISNAVLNVLPQDQRDALVVKMGELLKNGGRMFINVRGDDVKNASSKVAINEDLMEYYISKSGSYQKGFTKSELVAYLQDALGDGYFVTPTTFFGKTSAVVTKKEGQVMYSERDSSTSNRSILANALEGAAQNDIEKNKLAEYKKKISLIESEEQRLSEIQKQLFTKGAVEPSQRKDLQFEAKQIANRINTYDRQLLNLESTSALKNVLNREKALAMKRQKQKDAEAMRQYKEKVANTTRELLERNQESRKKAIEGREKTAMRHKIKSVVNDLNTLLLKPSKERHVPEEMRIAVAEALSIVNMDTVDADTRVAKYNDLIAKAKDPDVIASLTESRDRILEQGNKLADKLTKLKDAYGMVRDSADDSVRSMYDDVIYNKIESVQRTVGKTPLRNMTLAQLESVYDLYKMVLTTIRDSNKAFAENITMTRLALGSNTFGEIKDNNKTRDTIKHPSTEKFLWQNLKPMQAMKKIGSGTLQKLWNNILYGQETFAQDYDEAVKFAKEMKDKYGYKKWDSDKLYSFESKSGKVMKINLEQMMSIYAYSKRAQADEHIEYGGIVLNEGVIKVKNKLGKTVEVKVNDSTAYRLDKMQVSKIVSTLEKEFPGAKAFVDEMQKYLSETMGEKGNEVSMKMYGIKLFKEEHYFPLKSSKDFMEAANTKLKGDVKIKNKGMTKSTVEHARNPIVLENFLDVWGNHINEMALYHGLVLPLEDFSRTLNYSFKADEKLNSDAESVRTALHDAFGDNADNYLNELLKAINGGVLHDSSAQFADKMISKFKKAKVMASLSVIVQQPTAIVRAMGIIEPKYFVAQNFHHKQTWEELKKYCPTAIIKETGSFDTNMGRTIVDMVKDERGFTDKVGDFLGKAPAYMDEVGWNMIWRALKNKVATEQKLSGEALLQECGKQMTLIINETQVYDSVMSRNELMRSKNALTKMATAFMAEPSTVANMIYGAGLDFKRGKKGMASKTVAAVISSVVINGLVSALVYAARDDDDDETLLEKYLSSATTEVTDGLNPLTYIPFVKDIYSLLQGYKVERTDMALFKDVVDAIDDFFNVLDPEAYEGMSKKEIAKHIYDNSVPLLTSICDMFGLPVGNILRDVKSIVINDNVPMSQTSSSGIGYAFKEGALSTLPKFVQKIIGTDSKQDKLYDAIIKGDTAYIERLKSGYKDDKAYETAVRKALRENDSRIREAAEARIGGDIAEYTRIVRKIKAEGFFSQDTIVASVNAEINTLNKGEDISKASDTDKVESIYKMDDYYASIVGGDQATAYVVKENLIKTDVENGKDRDEAEDSFNSKFSSYIREQYEDGYISEQEAQRMLVNYGDKSEEAADSKVQYWTFKQKYPDYDDLSEEAVTKYYEDVEPYGIGIDVYYDYSKQKSKCKGTDNNGDGKTDSGSKKAEILQVIDSLPISRSQKDVLYYLNGWSARTIYEAPWH